MFFIPKKNSREIKALLWSLKSEQVQISAFIQIGGLKSVGGIVNIRGGWWEFLTVWKKFPVFHPKIESQRNQAIDSKSIVLRKDLNAWGQGFCASS